MCVLQMEIEYITLIENKPNGHKGSLGKGFVRKWWPYMYMQMHYIINVHGLACACGQALNKTLHCHWNIQTG